MTLGNGAPITASGACIFVFVSSCSPSYIPELERWPAIPDASIAAIATENAETGDAASAPLPVHVGSVNDASAIGPPVDAGPPPQQRLGLDASAVIDSGNATMDATGSAPRQPPDAGPPRPHAVTVVVTTVDDGQGYSPENVGAIWIAQSSGAFVKTLQVWAKTRMDHLILWNSATKAAGLPRNTVDAITGATQYAFGTHVAYWNLADTTEKALPDGAYRVYFETADWNATGPNAFVDFTKGPAPATFTFPDTPSFIDLKVVVSP